MNSVSNLSDRVADYQVVTAHGWPRQQFWDEALVEAQSLSLTRLSDPEANTHLIMVGAQHPLVDGTKPNPEFAARLDSAAELHRPMASEGQKSVIYVPGSRHRSGGTADKRALSDAGTDYLQEMYEDIDQGDMHGSDWVAHYNQRSTVYNGADEAAGTARAFRDDSKFNDLTMVVSPGQRRRGYATCVGT